MRVESSESSKLQEKALALEIQGLACKRTELDIIVVMGKYLLICHQPSAYMSLDNCEYHFLVSTVVREYSG